MKSTVFIGYCDCHLVIKIRCDSFDIKRAYCALRQLLDIMTILPCPKGSHNIRYRLYQYKSDTNCNSTQSKRVVSSLIHEQQAFPHLMGERAHCLSLSGVRPRLMDDHPQRKDIKKEGKKDIANIYIPRRLVCLSR